MKKLLLIVTILLSIQTKSNAQFFATGYYGTAFPFFDIEEELKNCYVGGEFQVGYRLKDKSNVGPFAFGMIVSNYTFDSKKNDPYNRSLSLQKLEDAEITSYSTTSVMATLDAYIFEESKNVYGGWEIGYLFWKSEGNNGISGIPYSGGGFAIAPVIGGKFPINKNIGISFRFNTMIGFTDKNGYFNTLYSSAKLGVTYSLAKKSTKKESSK
ncbi:MAG: hypothetical protein WCI53_01495 [Bacteroidota bacterium]|jgi:hypothetical protein